MDQDSFRRLLSSDSGSSTSSAPRSRPAVVSKQARGSLFKNDQSGSNKTPRPGDEASFKPRKIRRLDDRYRDRAAERRTGQGNDYAEVESVLEDFERRTENEDKEVVDEQRRYLGGDSEHTVLVKGLDIALLEANKAKAAQSTEEDDSLENAYIQAASGPASAVVPTSSSSTSVPKKRTREDIIRELKGKRASAVDTKEAAATQDTVIDKGRFKPIGFKPIGAPAEKEKKKKKVKGDADGERKKKKRKVDSDGVQEAAIQPPGKEDEKGKALSPAPSKPEEAPSKPQLEPQKKVKLGPPEDVEDMDIFAGAGDYEGVDMGDEDEDDDERDNKILEDSRQDVTELPVTPGNWFKTDVPEPAGEPSEPIPKPALDSKLAQRSEQSGYVEDGEASDDEQPMRLVPLSGSALPSIKDFLAIDEAAEAADKKRKRKEKRKGIKSDDSVQKQLSAEAKANRDYQRLQSYTSKSSK
ncbi:hypothetical protein K435DRAFT_716906 [Dendrothele bispora CBS 962.96]|uniref:RED-like N-terminal domain-containing protein n=1 Tax=Dendrothele bispora (strain CBS 962.96) TaxID=1314807 RepID=A0A4S8MJ92_DENBC|nr:hypothetical protein K435DRAFT_716906 [Dendrothele bispora CBS 962.96]